MPSAVIYSLRLRQVGSGGGRLIRRLSERKYCGGPGNSAAPDWSSGSGRRGGLGAFLRIYPAERLQLYAVQPAGGSLHWCGQCHEKGAGLLEMDTGCGGLPNRYRISCSNAGVSNGLGPVLWWQPFIYCRYLGADRPDFMAADLLTGKKPTEEKIKNRGLILLAES